jgi:hypothetical protein
VLCDTSGTYSKRECPTEWQRKDSNKGYEHEGRKERQATIRIRKKIRGNRNK